MGAIEDTVTVRPVDGNGTWLIALHGEHDALTVPHLAERTAGVWSSSTQAIVDLTEAEFIDSSVISWMLRTRSSADAPRVVLVEGPASVVSRILDVTGLRDVLPCYASLEAALAADRSAEHPVEEERTDRGTPAVDA